MKKQRFLVVFVFLAVLTVSSGLMAQAAPADNDGPVATARVNGTEINWQPKLDYASIVLTVSTPDGEVLRKEFAAGTTISLRLTDAKGRTLPEGSYIYELRVTPVIAASTREALAAARKNGTDEELARDLRSKGVLPKQDIVQSGAFSVTAGAFVMGGVEEGQKVGANAKPAQEEEVLAAYSQYKPFSSLLRPASTPFLRTSPNALARSTRGVATAPSVATLAARAAVRFFDQVIPDDLIVQGSACVGFDCVNNESFGFDTIRLKENSTRIKFEDTSVGSFPSNDWQLTANDSASGAANKFSIEDITGSKVPFTITAGAATNSIFVDSTGRLGLRTSTPVLDIHAATSNTPAMRLEQNNSGGFTAQTWDIAGNEANFFVRDVTGGSRLPFRIRPGAPTSSLDINASGQVGFGTASPTSIIHMNSGGATDNVLATFQNGTRTWSMGINGASDIFRITDNTLSAARFVITNQGNIALGGLTATSNAIEHFNGAKLTAGGVWTNASSRALKMNIRSLSASEAFKTLEKLNPVQFEYKAQPGEKYVGFISEDVPALVASSDRKSLSPMDMVAVLTKVLQEQQKTIAKLQEKVSRLEKRKVLRAKYSR
jgi:hypothetical protein